MEDLSILLVFHHTDTLYVFCLALTLLLHNKQHVGSRKLGWDTGQLTRGPPTYGDGDPLKKKKAGVSGPVVTVVMTEVLTHYWSVLKESDPGFYLTKTTQGFLEWKTWTEKMMSLYSIFNRVIALPTSHLNETEDYLMVYHRHFHHFGTLSLIL